MAKFGRSGNGHVHITETPDVSHIKNVDVTHEVSDVSVGGVLKFVVGLTVLTIGVFVLMLLLFNFLNAREKSKEPQPGPMAMTERERLPPEPRLQTAPGFGVKLENGQWVSLENQRPQREYQVIREQWDRVLTEGPKDASGRPVGLPIDEAMNLVIESKALPSRTSVVPKKDTDWQPEDYGFDMPTAASSGRMTEKRKQ